MSCHCICVILRNKEKVACLSRVYGRKRERKGDKNGGRWVDKGSVSYLFEKKGLMVFEPGIDIDVLVDLVVDAVVHPATSCIAGEDGAARILFHASQQLL